jgi:hypothetical protein
MKAALSTRFTCYPTFRELLGAATMMRGVKPNDTAKFDRMKESAMQAAAAASKLPTVLASLA